MLFFQRQNTKKGFQSHTYSDTKALNWLAWWYVEYNVILSIFLLAVNVFLYFCVRGMSHLTRDLFQAEKKITVVTFKILNEVVNLLSM